jgi:hypothetical protein
LAPIRADTKQRLDENAVILDRQGHQPEIDFACQAGANQILGKVLMNGNFRLAIPAVNWRRRRGSRYGATVRMAPIRICPRARLPGSFSESRAAATAERIETARS